MLQPAEIELDLQDTEWPYLSIDHERTVVRAIVLDRENNFYFMRAERNDVFGPATLIETSGGGVEEGEDLHAAIRRELREELGADVDVLCKIGVVRDYYNLIHRRNINHYFLCAAKSFGETELTPDEIAVFHLSTLRLPFDAAVQEYERCACTGLGRLIANRELPILMRAKELLAGMERRF